MVMSKKYGGKIGKLSRKLSRWGKYYMSGHVKIWK